MDHDNRTTAAGSGRRAGLPGRIWIWIRRLVLGLLALVVLLAASGWIYQTAAASRDARRFPPPGRMVNVGGFRLHLNCTGVGSPAVVLDGPSGSSSLGWSLVQPDVATFTRACSYDRAGYAWSEPGPAPRTSGRFASELRALLEGGGVSGPYVLVGSSIGGVNVRLLAGYIPDRVAGMVLVDSVHEDQFSRLSPAVQVSAAQLRTVNIFRLLSRVGLLRLAGMAVGEGSVESLPTDLRPAARAAGFRHAWIDAIYHELAALGTSLTEARAAFERAPAPLLGNKPLVVLTHGRPLGDSPDALQDERIWAELQENLLRLSVNSTQIIAERSGHLIQFDQPDLVVEAIRQVVEGTRHSAGAR